MDSDSIVVASGATSGLTINLHPLAILNISDHYTRAKLTSNGTVPKLIGALLGSQTGRDVSIVNSFELVYLVDGKVIIDDEFFKDRREQFAQVFPAQSVLGWYTIGTAPTPDDVDIHAQVAAADTGPSIFVVFNPDIPEGAQSLPFTVYESALEGEGSSSAGRFVQLECGVETGEAERIAVDGITKEVGGDGDETGQISSLTMQRNAISMQRNAISMLYDRVVVLVKYLQGVIDGTAKADSDVIRQIGALVATLPVMDASEFKTELQTEQDDVQLTDYLTMLLQQMEAWTTYTDMHFTLHPATNEEMGPGGMGRTHPGKTFNMPSGAPFARGLRRANRRG